jgi:hypothetical protein
MADSAMLGRALAARFGSDFPARVTALVARGEPGRPRAALRAALAHHKPLPGQWGTSCSCWADGGTHPVYPCPELTDIIMALAEEEEDGG